MKRQKYCFFRNSGGGYSYIGHSNCFHIEKDTSGVWVILNTMESFRLLSQAKERVLILAKGASL